MKKKHRNSTTGMNIAIVGGGFTGLTAAYELVKKGHHVTVFEKEKTLGGLAHGFKNKGWNWHLESAYHHLFTNDHAILDLIDELGISDKLILTRPVTANYVPSFVIPAYAGIQSKMKTLDSRFHGNDNILPFDSPIHLLTYPGLSFLDKLRTGILIALMKLNPFWQPLEWITAKKLFVAIGGLTAWRLLWELLMIGKFGTYAESVSASWLWARIKKRTQKLYYIQGGFHTLVTALEKAIKPQGGIIITSASVESIQIGNSHSRPASKCGVNSSGNPEFVLNWILGSSSPRVRSGEAGPRMTQTKSFDRLLLTVPTPIATKLISSCQRSAARLAQAPAKRVSGQLSPAIPHLHAQTLILETIEPILQDTLLRGCKRVSCEANGVYWLNIMDRSFPFLAVVAHTNMIDKKYYGGHHLTYFGNYLPDGHPYLSMTKDQLLKVFLPFIKRLNPSCQLSAVSCQLFTAPFAQPVHELHYSRRAPKLETPIPGVYLANMDSIYPWDRGTNYAVELGVRAAAVICHSRDNNVVIPAKAGISQL